MIGRSGRGQRGAGTVLVAMSMLVVLVVATVAFLVLTYAGAQRSCNGAADLAALAGASALVGGQDACATSAKIAAENDARVVRCEVSGDSIDFVVSVTVERPLGRWLGLPAVVGATSHAGRLAPG